MILVIFIFIFYLQKTPFVQQATRIEIQNGNTGEVTTLNDDAKNQFLDELLSLDTHVSGISGWSAGYEYKITFFITDEETKEVYVKNSSCIYSHNISYNVDEDLVEQIESNLSANE